MQVDPAQGVVETAGANESEGESSGLECTISDTEMADLKEEAPAATGPANSGPRNNRRKKKDGESNKRGSGK